jgi:signal transduction histidine kinase
MGEAVKLRDMAGKTVEEVGRVAHNLRPSVLDQLGLVAAIGDAGSEFADRTGITVKLSCAKLTLRLTAESELTLYRILQESLRNVEKHAGAKHVTVDLAEADGFVQLMFKVDGAGFEPHRQATDIKGKGGLGLFGMRERATYAGGTLEFKSVHGGGSEIRVRVPMAPAADLLAGALAQ